MEAREALLARVSAADGATEIKDPATGEVIGRHTFGTAADVKAAVDKAVAAQPAWAALTDEDRVGYLLRAADNIEAHAEELAYAIVREQGKTIPHRADEIPGLRRLAPRHRGDPAPQGGPG